GRVAPPPILTDVVYCGSSMAEAEEMADRYIARYFLSVVKHYDFAGTHFRDIKGYQAYEASAAMVREAGLEVAARAYRDSQSWGTPDAILPKYARWKEVLGDFSLNVIFSVAGMPYDVAERSQRKFAAEVMPALREMVDARSENAA
ncbi:MAG: LLM class flavin-dependent oxidoreductase, partial [Candidatus Binatia bacterium]